MKLQNLLKYSYKHPGISHSARKNLSTLWNSCSSSNCCCPSMAAAAACQRIKRICRCFLATVQSQCLKMRCLAGFACFAMAE